MKNFKNYTPEKCATSDFQKIEDGEPDFYEELNEESETICYQEFGSFDLEDIQRLRTIIGKRFYAVPYIDERNGAEYYNMVTE